jgi:importin subunit beta-1
VRFIIFAFVVCFCYCLCATTTMDFSQILLNTTSGDARLRTEAEQYLAASKAQNYGMFLTALTAELVEETKNPLARTAAGIILKNELSSQNEVKQKICEENWLTKLDQPLRDNIKNGIFHALGSPVVSSTAAQVCSCIAQIELPRNLWPTLIDVLLQNTTSNNAQLKKGTLQALGYICEEINPQVVESKSKNILAAITHSMRDEETDITVKQAAAKALENALEFAKQNFKVAEERGYIMSMVARAVSSPNTDLKVAGYECLVKIASLYYEFLPEYMQGLFNLTLEAIKKEDESVALQAIEFWSTICEEETCLLEEIAEAEKEQVAPDAVCHHFVKGALQFLVPVILDTLKKQDEDADEDQWDASMAGATCLTLIANCVGNDILAQVVPFVTGNLGSTEWRLREAATMAFGSILEGITDVSQIIQGVPVVVQHMQSDSSALVKDTSAWAIGRVCQLHPKAIQGDGVNFIMSPLLAALRDAPKVAANACWALHNIAENFRDEETRPAAQYKPYFEASVAGLLEAADRKDADENNLKASAYEAINEFIQSVETDDCKQAIHALVPIFLTRLEQTFADQLQALSQEDRDHVNETQGLLCSLLQTCTQKLDKEIKPNADPCAGLFLKVFNTKSVSVYEEALMAFGALANGMSSVSWNTFYA